MSKADGGLTRPEVRVADAHFDDHAHVDAHAHLHIHAHLHAPEHVDENVDAEL